MASFTRPDHSALAEGLRRCVLERPGETDPTLRQAVAGRAAGGPAAKAPFDDLARQIEASASRVTDAQVAAVLKAAGSEKAAFELIIAAATGAGLLRWQLALKAIQEASDASA